MDEQQRILLNLEFGEILPGGLVLILTITNVSSETLLVPYPRIQKYEIKEKVSGVVVEWRTRTLVAGGNLETPIWGGGEAKSFRYVLKGETKLSDGRWSVILTSGVPYEISYRLKVDDGFFDGDSHWRLADLSKEAAKFTAVAWTGSVVSNGLTLVRN